MNLKTDVMAHKTIRVLITGANGFIGKNLKVRLSELSGYIVVVLNRDFNLSNLPAVLPQIDVVVHLAGVNRPPDETAFTTVNLGMTVALCNAIRDYSIESGRKISLLFASSTQVELDNPYGQSKMAAEKAVQNLAAEVGGSVMIFRLPGVFGKWSRPNYNSVVATFCHNLSRGLPIHVSDPSTLLRLVYIDDVVDLIIKSIRGPILGTTFPVVQPEYKVTLGDLVDQIRAFDNCRGPLLLTERVGFGFVRALYSTYLSFFPVEKFLYTLNRHEDPRGVFVEVLKTHDSGQFSYFTVNPGCMRGGHYHHSKSEKFLVITGSAMFIFQHLITSEIFEVRTSGDKPQVVDTIPGWEHKVKNVGQGTMVVLLWANEVFDRMNPDTFVKTTDDK